LKVHTAKGLWTFVAAWIAIGGYYTLRQALLTWTGIDDRSAGTAAAALGGGIVAALAVGAFAAVTIAVRRQRKLAVIR
jgi:hypothetical protein